MEKNDIDVGSWVYFRDRHNDVMINVGRIISLGYNNVSISQGLGGHYDIVYRTYDEIYNYAENVK